MTHPGSSPAVRVDQLFSAQAARNPEAVAAVFGQQSWCYDELEQRARHVAGRLQASGVRRGSLVGIHLERSLGMLAVLLGVLKAGGAYVPLDPDYPAERLAHMVADAKLQLVVTQSSLASGAPTGEYRRIDIDDLLADAAAVAEVPDMDAGAKGEDLAYVLYTSGSTGRPKGVAVEHRNLVNFLSSMQRQPGICATDRLLAVTTLSFDIAGLELYLPLASGATLVMASREEAVDGDRLRDLIEMHGVNLMQATPTTWRVLVESGWPGRPGFRALCGGEVLPADLARTLLDRCAELWNLYGPTETTIWSTLFRVTDAASPILIGKAIEHTRVYVLDRVGRPAPIGVPGELYIAGAGVARGYLDRPQLTAEKFLPDPFSGDPGARMYRTGDMGRYLPDGNLEFRQRLDHQVKIRGFRVELGDIEAALESHPAVNQAIAKGFELGPGDTRLVGYVVAHGEAPGVAELMDHLRACLPGYMVPQHLTMVPAFPLTPNGKVDRQQLPMPDGSGRSAPAHVEPASPLERLLVDAFAEILGVDRVSADASFFDLGGHSVLAMRLVSRLRQLRHPDIGLRMLFDNPTPGALARGIEELEHAASAGETEEREAFQF